MAWSDEDILGALNALEKVIPKVSSPAAKAAKKKRVSEAELAKALFAIELAFLSPTMARASSAQGAKTLAATVTKPAFCRQYKAIEPYLEIVLDGLDWIPYGPTIAKVLRLLMRVADQWCSA